MSQTLHPMLNIAVKAARAAGAIINRAALDIELLKVSVKNPNDFVTEVDHASERVIIDTLLEAYPGHGILAEESGRARGAKDSEHVWIIDPLDGTTNFIHGLPTYAVSIALAVRGQVQQAVVYDPARNDLFYASKGRGAFLNDRRLRVSKRTRMSDSLIGTGFPFRKGDNFKRYLKIFEEVMQSCAGLRRPGAAALDLCYVAAGSARGGGRQPEDLRPAGADAGAAHARHRRHACGRSRRADAGGRAGGAARGRYGAVGRSQARLARAQAGALKAPTPPPAAPGSAPRDARPASAVATPSGRGRAKAARLRALRPTCAQRPCHAASRAARQPGSVCRRRRAWVSLARRAVVLPPALRCFLRSVTSH